MIHLSIDWLFNIAMENHQFLIFLIGKPSINGPSIESIGCIINNSFSFNFQVLGWRKFHVDVSRRSWVARCRLPTLAAVPAEHPRRVQVRRGPPWFKGRPAWNHGFLRWNTGGSLLIFLTIHWQRDLLLNSLLVPQVQAIAAMVDGLSKKYKFGSTFVRREPWWAVVFFETSESFWMQLRNQLNCTTQDIYQQLHRVDLGKWFRK